MKSRLVAVLTAASLALTLAACGDSGKEAAAKAEAAAKEAAP
jgi:predicted small lipoprotein YifL